MVFSNFILLIFFTYGCCCTHTSRCDFRLLFKLVRAQVQLILIYAHRLDTMILIFSLLRILYRIWQIYQKPIEELVDLLGLDIPSVPEISLAGVTAESALFYWKPLENQALNLRHSIQVNGIKGGCSYIETPRCQYTRH